MKETNLTMQFTSREIKVLLRKDVVLLLEDRHCWIKLQVLLNQVMKKAVVMRKRKKNS